MQTKSGTTVVGIAWYTAENYENVRRVMTDAHDLPDDFLTWLCRAQKVRKVEEETGAVVICVPVDPDAFLAWCNAVQKPSNATARRHYVALTLNDKGAVAPGF